MKKSNIESYKKIIRHLAENPGAKVTELCEQHKVPYQSYQSWFRRNSAQVDAIVKEVAPQRTKPLSKAQVQAQAAANETLLAINLAELAKAVAKGEKEIVFNVEEVVSKLPQNEQGTFLALVTRAIRDRR